MKSATKMVDMLKNGASTPLQNLLNLWAIDDDILVGTNYSMTAMFAITPSDLLHTEDNEVAMILRTLKTTLQALEQTATIQFFITTSSGDEKTIKAFENCSEMEMDISKYIKKSKVDKLRHGFLKNRKYYLSLTVERDKTLTQKKEVNPLKIWLKGQEEITAETDREIRTRLDTLIEEIAPGLESAKIHLRRLGQDEILKYIYEYLNPSRKYILPPPKLKANFTARSQLTFNAAENNFDNVYIDGFYHRAVNLYARPEAVSYHDIINLLEELGPDSTTVITLETGDQDEFAKEVRFTGTVARNVASMSVFQKNADAIMVGNAAEEMLDETKETFQKFFKYSLCVIFRNREVETLTKQTNAALKAITGVGGAGGIIDDMNHLNLFLTGIPGHSHLQFQKHVLNTEAVIQMIPVSAPWKGHKRPEIILKTKNSELLPINLFDPSLNAKHGLIVGSTGKGKSFTANYLLSNFFLQSEDNHVVIIEPGGSYRKLARTFGGEYLEIELGDKYAFNPFPSFGDAVKDSSEEHFDVDSDVLARITLLVQKMLKLSELTGLEQIIFEKAIKNTYKYAKTDPPLLGSFRYQLMNFEGDQDDKRIARDFGKNLEMWTEGSYGKLLNRQSTLAPDNRLIVFDLQKLDEQPDLQTIVFFLIQSVLITKLKNINWRKIIVMDEGWKFFDDPVGIKLINNLYRTGRKFNAGVYTISQSPMEFTASAVSTAIMSNSYVKFILGLESGHELLKKFNINAKEITAIEGLEFNKGKYSEVFLKFHQNSRIVRIEPSKEEYWLCTTDADDKIVEDKLRSENPDASEFEILQKLAEGK